MLYCFVYILVFTLECFVLEIDLRSTEVGEESKEYQELSSAVAQSETFTDLLGTWLTSGRSIACMRNDQTNNHVVGISFEQQEQGIAVGLIPSATVFKDVPGLKVIPGTIDEGVLDQFIEDRNERLNIVFNDDWQCFIAPRAALAELVFSYALAEKGFGQIQIVGEPGEERFFELFLVILTPSGSPDWGETIHVLVDQGAV